MLSRNGAHGCSGHHFLDRACRLGHPTALFFSAELLGLSGDLTSKSVTTKNKSLTDRLPFSMKMFLAATLRGSLLATLRLVHLFETNQDFEAAVYYANALSEVAGTVYNTAGKQPKIELDRISEYVDFLGNAGPDDELINYHRYLADKEGKNDSLTFLGHIYYWGSNGVERNQSKSFRYYQKASTQGYPPAMTALGKMLIKGEGLTGNVESPAKARELGFHILNQAADAGDIEALNGLGYIYYFGNQDVNVTRNVSTALSYFEQNLQDSDSNFNSAFILLNGNQAENDLIEQNFGKVFVADSFIICT